MALQERCDDMLCLDLLVGLVDGLADVVRRITGEVVFGHHQPALSDRVARA